MGCDECPSTTVGGDGERGEPGFDTVAHFPVNLFRATSQIWIRSNWQSRSFEVLLAGDTSA